jgi:hypothetical protein
MSHGKYLVRRRPGCGEATLTTSRRRKSCPSVQIGGGRGTGSTARQRLRSFRRAEVGSSRRIEVQTVGVAGETVADGKGGEQMVSTRERGYGLAAVVWAGLLGAIHRCAWADGDDAAESEDRDDEYGEEPHVWWWPGLGWLGMR